MCFMLIMIIILIKKIIMIAEIVVIIILIICVPPKSPAFPGRAGLPRLRNPNTFSLDIFFMYQR